MDSDVSQLEAALVHQAETLVREEQQTAAAMRSRILAESSEKLKLAGEREVLAAKSDAERLLRLQVQAAETRLAGDLDRLRWTLTETAMTAVQRAFQSLTADDAAYFTLLERWLGAAVRDLPSGDLVAEVRPEDEIRLAPAWPALVARAAPGRRVNLCSLAQPSLGGVRVRTVDDRARLDQTFEARQSRLADELARITMAQLFGSDGGLPGDER